MRLALLGCFICACATTVPPKPADVRILGTVTVKSTSACNLPALPQEPIIVGWPTAEQIYVTKSVGQQGAAE